MKKLPNIIADRDLTPLAKSPDLIHVPWLDTGLDNFIFALGWLYLGIDIDCLGTVKPKELLRHKDSLFTLAGGEGFWYGGGRRERGVFRCRPPPERGR